MSSIQKIYYPLARAAVTVAPMITIQSTPQLVLNQAELLRADRNQPVIMPLGSSLATASVEWHAPVYWVSIKNPADILGALLEQFHGIYHSPAGLLCLQLGDTHNFFRLPKPMADWGADHFQWLMARVLQMALAGQTDAAIVAEINRHGGDIRTQEAA